MGRVAYLNDKFPINPLPFEGEGWGGVRNYG